MIISIQCLVCMRHASGLNYECHRAKPALTMLNGGFANRIDEIHIHIITAQGRKCSKKWIKAVICRESFFFFLSIQHLSLHICIYEELTVSHDEIVTNMVIDVVLIQIVLCTLPVRILGKGRTGWVCPHRAIYVCLCVHVKDQRQVHTELRCEIG